MFSRIFPFFALLFLLILRVSAAQAAPPPIKIGVLAFGTLAWEIAVIRSQGLDREGKFTLETTELAGVEAGKIALQGRSVDLIVADWIWAARQRAQGEDFLFAPYSTSHGALLVPADSPIREVGDLQGKRLGIVGGGLDKNWLLLRAMADKTLGIDLDRAAQKVFGAPPLLIHQLRQGKVDAVLNYWNHAAKLEAEGYRRVLDGRGMLRGLGIETEVPALGYVFRESWAKPHETVLAAFLRAAAKAKQAICDADETWHRVAPLTGESDEKVRAALRRGYCEGRVKHWGEAEQQAAATLYGLLAKTAGGREGKNASELPAGVFWTGGGLP